MVRDKSQRIPDEVIRYAKRRKTNQRPDRDVEKRREAKRRAESGADEPRAEATADSVSRMYASAFLFSSLLHRFPFASFLLLLTLLFSSLSRLFPFSSLLLLFCFSLLSLHCFSSLSVSSLIFFSLSPPPLTINGYSVHVTDLAFPAEKFAKSPKGKTFHPNPNGLLSPKKKESVIFLYLVTFHSIWI